MSQTADKTTTDDTVRGCIILASAPFFYAITGLELAWVFFWITGAWLPWWVPVAWVGWWVCSRTVYAMLLKPGEKMEPMAAPSAWLYSAPFILWTILWLMHFAPQSTWPLWR